MHCVRYSISWISWMWLIISYIGVHYLPNTQWKEKGNIAKWKQLVNLSERYECSLYYSCKSSRMKFSKYSFEYIKGEGGKKCKFSSISPRTTLAPEPHLTLAQCYILLIRYPLTILRNTKRHLLWADLLRPYGLYSETPRDTFRVLMGYKLVNDIKTLPGVFHHCQCVF